MNKCLTEKSSFFKLSMPQQNFIRRVMNNKLLSFVLPSRNNLEYLKIAYNSIRKNSVDKHWICFADDCSNDGTKQWLAEIKKKDDRVKYLVNKSRDRIGHTFLYDEIIDKLVETEIFVIWHADMYMLPGADLDFLNITKEYTLTSLTRIEPPLHPSGPEKIQMNFGVTAKSFNEERLLKWYNEKLTKGGFTEGIFAPWSCYKSTFQSIGGHDWLFIPQSKEDSDIFNRLQLLGCKFIQTWGSHCYHFTSRGSRFNEHLTSIGTNSNEWDKQNRRSTRNFIRKWGSMVRHDQFMNPQIPHKRNIKVIIEKPSLDFIGELEPFCSNIIVEGENSKAFVDAYIEMEKNNTLINLNDKFEDTEDSDIIIRFRGKETKDLKEIVSFLNNLDYIIENTEENITEYQLFSVEIINRDNYLESDNIFINNRKDYQDKYSKTKIEILQSTADVTK